MDGFWIIALFALAFYAVRFLLKPNEKTLRSLGGVYIVWVFVNIVILVSSDKYGSAFFPFDNARVDDYDYGEFIVYVFGPLVLVWARNLIKN